MAIPYTKSFAFTGEINPVIIPYTGITRSGQNGLSQTGSSSRASENFDERRENDVTFMGVKMSDIQGTVGQRLNIQGQLVQLESRKNELYSNTMNKITNAATDAEREKALNDYNIGLSRIKTRALEIGIYGSDLKEDNERLNKDRQRASDEQVLQSPTLLMDFGSVTDSKQGNGAIAERELFDKSVNGIIAVDKYGNAIKKTTYLDMVEKDSRSYTDNGMPVRYDGLLFSETPEKYNNKIKSLMEVNGMIKGERLQMIGDNGEKISVGASEISSIIHGGQGYQKITSESNINAIRAAVTDMYDNLTPGERNQAFEQLLSSGQMSRPITVSAKGVKETIGSSTYSQLSSELQSIRTEYANEKNSDKRELLFNKGMAISRELINGVKDKVIGDALSHTRENIKQSTSTTQYRSTPVYEKRLANDAVYALLRPEYIPTLPTAKSNVSIWDNKISMTVPGYTATTPGTKGQKLYLFDNGIKLDDDEYQKNRKSLLDLTGQFVMNNMVMDMNMMNTDDFKHFKDFKITRVGNRVRTMAPIVDGKLDYSQGLMTYIEVVVAIPKSDAGDIKVNIPEKEVRREDGIIQQRFILSDEKTSLKRLMNSSNKIEGLPITGEPHYNEATKEYEMSILTPVYGTAIGKNAVDNAKYSTSAEKANKQGQFLKNNKDKVFGESYRGDTDDDEKGWSTANQNLVPDIEQQMKEERAKEAQTNIYSGNFGH